MRRENGPGGQRALSRRPCPALKRRREGETVARASTLPQPALRGDVVLVLYAVGWLLVVLALAMLVPAAVDASQGEPEWRAFVGSAAITLFFGTLLVLSCQGRSEERRVG